MARASFATWVGPTVNQGGAMTRYDGLVIHIAEGSYFGTIAWQRNPSADVSSHFIVAKDGRISQMVDTSTRSWCQAAGNSTWLSVENEGFHGDTPPAAQIEALAQIYAWCMTTHGIAAQISNSPNVGGLGWHGMGGTAWGGHFDCPGEGLKNARPAILSRALQINGSPPEGDMAYFDDIDAKTHAYRTLTEMADLETNPINGEPNKMHARLNSIDAQLAEIKAAIAAIQPGGGGPVSGPVDLTDAAVSKVAVAVADEDHRRSES